MNSDWIFEERRHFNYDEGTVGKPVDAFQGTFSRAGIMGNIRISHALEVNLAYHTGSGFGAKAWPHVRIDVPFRPGEETRAAKFAAKVRTLIDQEFGQLDS